ncbi:hypothetical protein SynWH8103_00197 [Synechococcus sp. WH 8103]|nr:hypothetical protein SynWH8103_00197 [Synechococcus sp. WH 8103]
MTKSTIVGSTEGNCVLQPQLATDTPHLPTRGSQQVAL